MSSSTSPARVLRGDASVRATGLPMPDLRTGGWTRWGDPTVRGDETTEQLLDQLAERTHGAARAQGYATGWAQGRREALEAGRRAEAERERDAAAAEARRAVEHTAALAALHEAADQLHRQVKRAAREAESCASSLALALTRELVGAAAADAGEHALARVAALLPDTDSVRVRLHPTVAPGATDLQERGVTVVPDPELGPADAVVETDDHVVDLRLESALERLREVLR